MEKVPAGPGPTEAPERAGRDHFAIQPRIRWEQLPHGAMLQPEGMPTQWWEYLKTMPSPAMGTQPSQEVAVDFSKAQTMSVEVRQQQSCTRRRRVDIVNLSKGKDIFSLRLQFATFE
ncbi:hypothetical protein E2320_016061 [Naja naja]|nr:hypothetical protein E2320_016061 [Naja naja]